MIVRSHSPYFPFRLLFIPRYSGPFSQGLERRVPFCPSIATLPRSPREAEYLSKRKFTLVNGMHTVLAFLTLCLQYRGTDREYVVVKYAFLPRR